MSFTHGILLKALSFFQNKDFFRCFLLLLLLPSALLSPSFYYVEFVEIPGMTPPSRWLNNSISISKTQ